jgi:DNA-binding transcriptional LysR family regulator
MPALTRSLMGPVFRQFMRERPNLTITGVEAVSTELVERVKASELDVAIVPVFEAPPSLRCRAVGSSPEVVVGRGRRHPQHMRPVSLADLGSLKLILQSPGNMRRERILAHLRAQGIEIASLLNLDSMFGTLEYARSSDYLTVLPSIMVFPEIEQATLCVRPIKDKGFMLDMMAIESKRNARSSSIDALIEAFAEQPMDWPPPKRLQVRS